MDTSHLRPPWVGEHEFSIDPEELPTRPALSSEHEALLTASGIAPEIWQERGYETVYEPRVLRELGFSKPQSQLVPALLVPLLNPYGEESVQIRPDHPRSKRDKRRKYESRWKHPLVLDV